MQFRRAVAFGTCLLSCDELVAALKATTMGGTAGYLQQRERLHFIGDMQYFAQNSGVDKEVPVRCHVGSHLRNPGENRISRDRGVSRATTY